MFNLRGRLLSSLPVNKNRALIARLDQSNRTLGIIEPSGGLNTRSAPAAPTHPDLCLGNPALSPLVRASLKLSLVHVKKEETPISLMTLRQSQSLKQVKKESWSPSLHFMVRPHRRTHSPPRLQSLSPPHGQPQPPPLPPGRPPSPPPPVMATPAPIDKEVLKLLLPLRYDGKTVVECNRFLSQLHIYWQVNTVLTTIELRVHVALSLLDGDARAWATPIFAQLVSIQIGTQGASTPFTDEATFATAFRARFGHLDDEVTAQVELAKLCADKTMCEKRTATEFSALFKGPADRSGYEDLELRNKYLSSIPSHVY
ncbi:predicted protein [Postia placenta Mad-698-R]|uniref:DUF4939 domain-containing protein n=1 Tax=Postia placenta MAD-698-R-SB12 TaxID=670580 RepID=A0A1X6N0Q8_9APHY|nr:hypothetical protein POSPLADRAFT_1056781 [Postia placenta MAD-698-R-SB12]EED77939.1 predicted protein [Postia placenta Mad-698-R]OSX62197.1 hypothetical protein POSPLADRAFT_1056781 [Postia placenta MAD-698-R-SB12]